MVPSELELKLVLSFSSDKPSSSFELSPTGAPQLCFTVDLIAAQPSLLKTGTQNTHSSPELSGCWGLVQLLHAVLKQKCLEHVFPAKS